MTQIKYTTSLDAVTCFLYCSCNSVVLRADEKKVERQNRSSTVYQP